MVNSTTMMYIFMGVMYVVLFIVIGTFLVFRQRRREAREKSTYRMGHATALDENEEDNEDNEEGDGTRRTRSRKRVDEDDNKDRLRKIAKNLEDTLENSMEETAREEEVTQNEERNGKKED